MRQLLLEGQHARTKIVPGSHTNSHISYRVTQPPIPVEPQKEGTTNRVDIANTGEWNKGPLGPAPSPVATYITDLLEHPYSYPNLWGNIGLSDPYGPHTVEMDRATRKPIFVPRVSSFPERHTSWIKQSGNCTQNYTISLKVN